jgi:hypothetical protein
MKLQHRCMQAEHADLPMRADMLASEARAARWRKNGFKRKREKKKGYKMHAATTDVKRKADPAANSYIRDCEREHTGPHLQRYAVALYGGKQRRSCNCRHARHTKLRVQAEHQKEATQNQTIDVKPSDTSK